MKRKKLMVWSLTAVLCTGIFMTGCGTGVVSDADEAEPEEVTEERSEEEPEEEEKEEAVYQKIGDPDADIEILMTNELGEGITGLELKDSAEDTYSENILGNDQIIENGETVIFSFDSAASDETDVEYTLKVTLDNEDEYELSNFNLDDMSEVILCIKGDVAHLKYLSISKNIVFNTIEIEQSLRVDIEVVQAADEGTAQAADKETAQAADEGTAQADADQTASTGEVTSANTAEEEDPEYEYNVGYEYGLQGYSEEQLRAENKVVHNYDYVKSDRLFWRGYEAGYEKYLEQQKTDLAAGWTADSAYQAGYNAGYENYYNYDDMVNIAASMGMYTDNPYYNDFVSGFDIGTVDYEIDNGMHEKSP